MPAPLFEIDELHVSARSSGIEPATEILTGVSLVVNEGEIHALVGPSGSGKSTLAATLLGAPGYEVTSGSIKFRGNDITQWDTEMRAKVGIFLAFQNPLEIAGVSVFSFLRQAISARTGIDMTVHELKLSLTDWMTRLQIDHSFMDRFVNEGFSEGEKKRNEILMMAILEPEMAILDETDTGLDTEALQVVASGVQEIRRERPKLGMLAITNDQRLLDHLHPDIVHVLIDGQIVTTGGPEMAITLEVDGYGSFR